MHIRVHNNCLAYGIQTIWVSPGSLRFLMLAVVTNARSLTRSLWLRHADLGKYLDGQTPCRKTVPVKNA